MQKLREFFSKKKFVSNDSELSNSARNGKKNWRQIAVFGGSGGTDAVFFKVSKHLCQEKTFLLTYLCSEIKTKPKNHGLHESCKTPPPLKLYYGNFIQQKMRYNLLCMNKTILFSNFNP